MTGEFAMVQSLAAGVDDRSGAWEFVRGFAAHWGDALGDDDGWTETDLEAAEARLGVRLPPALREGYALFGRRPDLTSNHDVLLDPAELYVDHTGEALVFRHENQGAASWGIPMAALADEDPGVVVRADLADKDAERWEGWMTRLSLAFVEIVLSESLQAEEGLCDFLGDLDGTSVELLERNCTRLPFPAYPISEEDPGTRWFLGADVLLRDDDGTALLARARTEAALDRIRDLIPGDWLNDCR